MSDFTLRRALARDSEKLVDCIDAAYSIYSSTIDNLPAVSDGIDQAITQNLVWVAEVGSRIAGGMVVVPQKDFLLLENIAVHPDCSGMGLGRALITQAEQICLNLGLRQIRLSTHEKMPENVAIYTHLGFIETGRSDSKVHMVREL